jgi:hypothetical protein
MNPAHMKPGDIYLGLAGQEVRLPEGQRKLTETRQEIVHGKRSANGTYLEDIIRVYTDYQIDYEILQGPDYDLIMGLVDLNQFLNLLIANRDGTLVQQMVKVHKPQGTRDSTAGDWLWTSVSLLLEAV